MKKRINKEIIVIAIISILFLMMSIVYANYLYNSNDVSFNNNNTTLTSTDVQSAIDELYNKCSNVPEVGSCPEGYECTPLTRVTYNVNGGSFSGGSTTNDVYYSVVEGDIIEKISKTRNVDDNGNRITTGTYDDVNMPGGTIADVITIDGADTLEVTITYQTKGTGYAYVAVFDSTVTASTSNTSSSVSGELGGTTKTTTTYTVTGDTVKILFHNVYSSSSSYSNYYGYYAKVKGKKNNEYIREILRTKEEGEYKEPIKQGEYFWGWNTASDGSGQTYANEQSIINSLDTENRNVVLYGIWKNYALMCRRATTLHTEICTNSSSSNYCTMSTAGHSLNETITYGKLGTWGEEPTSGDAFDCDVNNDGTYDSATERFYYVSNYFDTSTKTFDDSYATLIYYSNTSGGTADTSHTISWASSKYNYNGPETAITQLPTTSGNNAWRNNLLKTTTRNILYGTSPTSATNTYKSNFSYSGYAARLLTMQELYAGCYDDTTTVTSTGGLINKCEYLMEQTKYTTDSYVPLGSWLETAKSSYNTYYFESGNYSVGDYDHSVYTYFGVRPVIEINKSLILY